MKAARLVVLGVAITAGGVAALMAGRSHEPAPQKAAAPVVQLPTVQVLVAKTDLSRGHLIDEHDIGWQAWPKAAANGKFIEQSARPDALKQFVGAIVRVPVASGQPIYDPMVVFAKGSGFLAAMLPAGMRAIAMDVSAVTSAGGFILPDDHVDIMLTRNDTSADNDSSHQTGPKLVSETILKNVTVLAVDQAVQEKKGEKAAVGRTVTVEVTPQQAQMLVLARQQGTLSLSLRSLRDSQSSTPESVVHEKNATAAINTVRYGVNSMTTVER
jgi:pilus assembly protein CpaB